MKANNIQERRRFLKMIGGLCKRWRQKNGLRLVDVCKFGVSVNSLSNFEYGFNDSALAYQCYLSSGFTFGEGDS